MQGLSDLRAICSAPGKVILFGEHAVVYGHPALAAATDQRTHVEVDCCGTEFTVNGFRIHDRFHSYLLTAVNQLWDRKDPIRIQTEGGVPSASGTGSSAALTVACVGALHRLLGRSELADLAQSAFRVERGTQGGGSPTDTSTATAGGGIAISRSDEPPGVGTKLWDVAWEHEGEERRSWTVERIDIPDLTVVVGNSGVKGRTDEQVAKVAHAARKNAVVRDALADIGRITRQAVPLLRAKDFVAVGALMDKAHAALHMVGVNHPAVEQLVKAARATPGTLGAKLTGAGGGGSMFALTERPQAVAAAIQAAGGTAYTVKLGGPGVQWHDTPPGATSSAASAAAAGPPATVS
ncbi:MAG TPA: mevalonate kinase [Candidatus Thermoplasmatota archaeon]|nr:mevalonate kinase [Candidatus Thermoplasmatota archaeon]